MQTEKTLVRQDVFFAEGKAKSVDFVMQQHKFKTAASGKQSGGKLFKINDFVKIFNLNITNAL